VLNVPHTRRDHRIDWLGALTITIALVPLLTVAEQGRSWGWGSGRSLGCFAVGAAGLLAFVWAEKRAGEEALIPLRMFRNRTFSIVAASSIVVGMGMFGAIAMLPLYLQIVRGATPTKAGLLLLPLSAGIMAASVLSGQLISRTGKYKIFPVAGTALMTAGLLLLHTVGVDTPFWHTAIYMTVFGFGLGNLLQPVTLAVQNAMPPRDIGVATSSATFFRQMGGTAGTAVFLSVLFSTVGDNIRPAFADAARTPAFQRAVSDPATTADPASRAVLGAVKNGGAVSGSALDDTSFLQHINPVLARPFKTGFSESMDLVFVLGAVILVAGFVLVLFLPQLPLRTTSAMASRDDGTPGPGAAGGGEPGLAEGSAAGDEEPGLAEGSTRAQT
jgi:hypothetical protein